MDEFNDEGGGTLRFLRWGPDMSWPTSGPLTIQPGVDPAMTVIEPDRKVAVFSSHRAGAEGLYAVTLPRQGDAESQTPLDSGQAAPGFSTRSLNSPRAAHESRGFVTSAKVWLDDVMPSGRLERG